MSLRCMIWGHLWRRLPEPPREYSVKTGRAKLRKLPPDRECVVCGLADWAGMDPKRRGKYIGSVAPR